jgi:small-conductance mechanosensitive channel
MFADSGIEYETAVYIADPQNGKLGVQSAMNRAIWRAFHENGISIPYPQRGAVLNPATPLVVADAAQN